MYDAGARGRAAEVPTRVALLDLLALERGDGEEVASRWVLPRDNLAAPVGAGATGPFTVDLRRDGPHSLVVGTTGSGKSELLRTLVCSLAVLHPPTRVSFLLFDYKGGAAFGPCVGLPHVVDVVSDLDDQLARRALIALEAELVRRERILSDAGAKDMLELARRTTRDVPPALILAVDEFAKLARRSTRSSTGWSTSRSAAAAWACTWCSRRSSWERLHHRDPGQHEPAARAARGRRRAERGRDRRP